MITTYVAGSDWPLLGPVPTSANRHSIGNDMASRTPPTVVREYQPLARDLQDAVRVLPLLQVSHFPLHLEEYKAAALGIVLPVFQRLYDERIEELDGSGPPADPDARLAVHDTIESAEQTTAKAIVLGLHHMFEQQRKEILKESRSLHHFQKLLQKRTGLDARTWPCDKQLEDLRFTANVIKHASGRDVRTLRTRRPDLFRFGDDDLASPALTDMGFYVSDKDLEDWFDAVKAFWTTLHERLADLARQDPEVCLRLEGNLPPNGDRDSDP